MNVSAAKCVVLVPSCDAYSDLWVPFFRLLRQYWPDCPFEILLGANRQECEIPGVKTLFSNAGLNFSNRLQDYLSQIEHEFVFLILEDYFLRKPVSTQKIMECLRLTEVLDAQMVRLVPRPRPTRRIRGINLIGEAEPGSPYRVCLQAAIWRRGSLQSLLRPDESSWEFELKGTSRSLCFTSGFYAVWKSVLPYEGLFFHHVVRKGRWLPQEAWLFRRRNVGCDFGRRQTWSRSEGLPLLTIAYFNNVLNLLPWRLAVVIKSTIGTGLSPFVGSYLKRFL